MVTVKLELNVAVSGAPCAVTVTVKVPGVVPLVTRQVTPVGSGVSASPAGVAAHVGGKVVVPGFALASCGVAVAVKC